MRMTERTGTVFSGFSANTQGMIWMILSGMGFVLAHVVVRHFSFQLHPFVVTFFIMLFGAFVVLPSFARHGLAPLRTARLKLHITRSVCIAIAVVSMYYALSTTPIALVTALSFLVPIFSTLLAWPLLGEKLRLRRFLAIVVGFGGSMIILRPGFADVGLGQILVIISAVFFSLSVLLIRKLGRTDSSITITSYTVILTTSLSLLPALFFWEWPNWGQLAFLAPGGIAAAIGVLLLSNALRLAATNVVMPLDYMRLLWASLLGFLFFSEIPDLFTWVGAAVILASATYIGYRESVQRKLVS
jgi:drug/metabolite transporter (DMT)-like permease